MRRALMTGAALGLAALPVSFAAQEGEKLDCVALSVPGDTKAAIGEAMAGGGDEASREALFKDLASITEACVTRHGITAEQKGPYFDYSLARISREWRSEEHASELQPLMRSSYAVFCMQKKTKHNNNIENN